MCPFPRSRWTYPDGRGRRCEPLPAPRGGRRVPRGTVRQPELGNIRNDASLEAMLKYLAAVQPGAVLGAVCAGPQTVKDRYVVPAIALR